MGWQALADVCGWTVGLMGYRTVRVPRSDRIVVGLKTDTGTVASLRWAGSRYAGADIEEKMVVPYCRQTVHHFRVAVARIPITFWKRRCGDFC